MPAEIRRRHRRDQTLFGDQITYAKLASLLGQGSEIRITGLTSVFTWQDYLEEHGDRVTPLFALDPQGHITPFGGVERPTPGASWQMVGLIHAPEPREPADPD